MSGVAREAQSTTANKDRDRVKDFVLGRSSLSVASAYRQQHFDWIIRAINRTDECSPMPVAAWSTSNKNVASTAQEAATSLSRVKRPVAKKKLHQMLGSFCDSWGTGKCFLLFFS